MTAAETQILLNELQSKIDKLPTKGTLKALEFRLDAILQANLDTFWSVSYTHLTLPTMFEV